MENISNSQRIKRPWYFTTLILFMVPLAGMGIDVYTPSLPTFTIALHTSMQLAKLTLPMYLLGYAVGPLLFGTLSDKHGRKKVLAYGMVFYIISCVLIIAFANIWFILGMRFIQGFAIGSSGAIYKAMITDTYDSGNEIRKMVAMTSAVWALGPIAAPFIGGYLQHYFGWQANFIFLLIYAILILISLFFIPETNMQRICLNWPTILRNYRTVIAHPIFWSSIICMGMVYSLIVIFNIVGPFLIQMVLHYSAVQFGHIALVMGLAFFVGSLLNRLFVQRFSSHFLIVMSLSLMLIISVVMLLLGVFFAVNLYFYTVPVFLVFFFSAFTFPTSMARAMSLFPKIAGSANALVSCLFLVFTGLTTIIASFFVSSNQITSAIAYVVLIFLGLLAYLLLNK